MKNILFFENMITTKIITVVYWLMLLGVVGWSLKSIFGGYGGFSFMSLIYGLVSLVIGAIGVRIWCELMIVMFKINEALQDIRQK